VAADCAGQQCGEAEPRRLDHGHALDLGIANRVSDLALVVIEPDGAGQGADAFGQASWRLIPRSG
jgi:hypothetical protein